MTPPIDVPTVLIRVVKYPPDKRGELLVVYVETRTVSDPAVVVYSVPRCEFRVEHHVHLRWQTKRASLEQQATVADALKQMGWDVRIVQSAPRAFDSDPDEAPAPTQIEKRRARPTGYFTRKRVGT